MGKLRSYLSQVQDFLANPMSRNVVLNDLYQEALELLFNDNTESPKRSNRSEGIPSKSDRR